MCGIVGAVAKRDVVKILLKGLKRLEYRGYDSAGVAVIDGQGEIGCLRTKGKVAELAKAQDETPTLGYTGIAHTRWATHGEPSTKNAHPHLSHDNIAIVHNGIIENYSELKVQLQAAGYTFHSETDTEVVAHLFHQNYQACGEGIKAASQTLEQLKGAYALAILIKDKPDSLIAVRKGSPLVIGLGIDENFVASDYLALLPVAQNFIYLEDGDIAYLESGNLTIYDASGVEVTRPSREINLDYASSGRGKYRHYMLKEIYEQSSAVSNTLEGRLGEEKVLPEIFGVGSDALFDKAKRVQIVACGTSYHAAMVARYWIEANAKLPCQVEIASEFRYRQHVVEEDTLFITLSQSGETADTLAALRQAKEQNYLATLAICNVPESSLVRESDFCLMMHAGPEVGVASTKAFTTQLVSLLLLTAILSEDAINKEITSALKTLPAQIELALKQNDFIKELANDFADKNHTLFLGRGVMFPIAMEGSLKLKEISYIHAEAYPAGELKHGPLALVDEEMPVVVVAPNDELLEKLQANMQEVQARGGKLVVFANEEITLQTQKNIQVSRMPTVSRYIMPIVYTIPLQLLSYHVALIKGTDVDQPRNLAKSVTVE